MISLIHLPSVEMSNIAQGKSATQSASHSLAVKSNYGCIRDGSHSDHGLNYPESFVSDTFSKQRTHAINERNRRDRLSQAIRALQSVVPQMDSVEMQKKGPPRAITVEKAIEYIVTLQREVDRLRKESSAITQDAENLSDPKPASNNPACS